MVNQDDSFIREVNEELRSDQMRLVWKRFGRVLIGAHHGHTAKAEKLAGAVKNPNENNQYGDFLMPTDWSFSYTS